MTRQKLRTIAIQRSEDKRAEDISQFDPDNAAIHHLEQIEDMITGVGALIRFLPPYSPDLMPLEEAFSQVKSSLVPRPPLAVFSQPWKKKRRRPGEFSHVMSAAVVTNNYPEE